MASGDLSADPPVPGESRHLSHATEELSACIFTFIEDAIARQNSAGRNAVAANLYAAEKASTALGELQTTLDKAMARLQGEIRESMDAAARRSDELKELGEGLRQELQSGLEEIAGSRRDALKASNEVQRSVAAIEAAVAGARQALEQAQGLAQHAEESAAAVTAGAQKLAEELQPATVASEQIAATSARLDSIERNLEQASAENQRLATQVESLARRFSGSSNGVTLGPPAVHEALSERTPPPQSISREVAYPRGAGKALVGLGQQRPPQTVAEADLQGQKLAVAQRQIPREEVPVEASSVSGSTQVTLSPIRDFEQVVRMDKALAGLACVGDVALERYAQDEATFLVDLTANVAIADFARELGEAAGVSAMILAGTDGFVALHVA